MLKKSRPAWGAWIETPHHPPRRRGRESRPARGAWIETVDAWINLSRLPVAPRTGRVD